MIGIQITAQYCEGANIGFIGEAPSPFDVQTGRPFSGTHGDLMEEICRELDFNFRACFLTHAAKRKAPNNYNPWFWKRLTPSAKSCPPGFEWHPSIAVRPELSKWRELLYEEIANSDVNVLIPLGEIGLWMLTGRPHIVKWRGSTFNWTHPNGRIYKVIPTHAPEEIMKRWDLRFIVKQDIARALREQDSPLVTKPDWVFILRPSLESAIHELDWMREEADYEQSQGSILKVSSDIETRGGHIACIGLGIQKLRAICIPLMCIENDEGYWTPEEEVIIVSRIKALLHHPAVRIIGQNYIFDLQYTIKHWGISGKMYMDTMLAQHLCFPSMKKSLDFLASLYCDYYCYWKDDGKTWEKGMDEEQLWAYNCEDVVYTLECAESLTRVIKSRGLEKPWRMQKAKYPLILETMMRGVRIQTDRRSKFAWELMKAMSEVLAWVETILGHPLNPRSSSQMNRLFYTDFKQKIIKNPATHQPTCGKEAMLTIALREPILRPLCEAITLYRTMGVFLSTFVRAELDSDNRIRCQYTLAGTETFRLKSSKNAFGKGTNLQNIPRNQEE